MIYYYHILDSNINQLNLFRSFFGHKIKIQDLNDARESNDRLKTALEERITDQLIERRTVETTELVELRRTMVECEMELHELREQYLLLKTKAEHDLTKEHKKIGIGTHILTYQIKL